MRVLLSLVVSLGLLAGADAVAGTSDAVPSCYQATGLTAPVVPPEREIFILIDQTTLFDDGLKHTAEENVRGFLGPNSAYQVIVFSAFSQGRYTTVVTKGFLEAPFPEAERASVSERKLAELDHCLQAQEPWAKKHVIESLRRSFSEASPNLAKSDILAAIRDVAGVISGSPGKRKVLFLVSDMLENSSITSFYGPGGSVRRVDPLKELARAEKADVLAKLAGSTVDVLGAGVLPPKLSRKASYRDPQTLAALRSFWAQYFEKSGAVLDQFGEPDLLAPIR